MCFGPKMSFRVLGCEHHSFWGRLTGREKVDLGSLLSRPGIKLPVCLKVIVTGKLVSSWSTSNPDFFRVLVQKCHLAFWVKTFGVDLQDEKR